MTDKRCARLWEVEAARDGRLSDSDLSNALRHGTECVDCRQAAEALSELGRQIKGLPVPPADPLVQRRTRRALLAAWNEHQLAGGEPKTRRRGRLIVAFCAAGAVALAASYPLIRHLSQSPERAGRVRVRSNAQPGFVLKAGEAGQPQPQPQPSSLPNAAPDPLAARASGGAGEAEPTLAKPSRVSPAAKRTVAPPQPEPAAARPPPNSAEDDAYLQIIDLLRNGHEPEARAKAERYLVRFPNGFRRLEVANIAKR